MDSDHRGFRRLATALVGHPRQVLAVWLILIACCAPFALQLPDVLSKQGASKIVPGSTGDAVNSRLIRAFPQHSERETFIVISADDVRAAPARRLLAGLNAVITPLLQRKQVIHTGSAYTLYRDATEAAIRATLDPGAVGAALTPEQAEANLRHATSAGKVPAGLTGLLNQAAVAPASWSALASQFASSTDWKQFPLPVDASSYLSADHRTALLAVGYSPRGPDPDLAALRKNVQAEVDRLGVRAQVTTAVTGELALIKDTYDRAEADNAKMEYAAYIFIIIVLILFFRALVPAVLTLVLIGLAMLVSQAWLYVVGRQVELTQFTSTIMVFVMLGAGVDYSMLLSSRYRQERVAGRPVRDAVIEATVHAGRSMALAGTAVVIAFAATLLAPVDWIPPLGYGGLAGIPVMLLAALTITPCLLILLGDRFFALGRQPLSDLEADGMLARQLRRLTSISRRFPIPVVVTFLLVTIPFAVVVVSHPMTSDPVALSPDTDARRGYQEIARTWGAGTLQPTVVVGKLAAPTGPAVTPFDYQRLRSLVTAIRSIDGVASTRSLTSPAGQPLGYPDVVGLPADVRQDYLAVDGTFRLVITLAGDPLSDAARNTVAQVAEVVANGPVPGAQVGGATVVDEEYDHALNLSFWRMVSLVSAGVFLLLLFALGSLLIPVRLVATIIMSNIWAIGITFLVFQVWLGEPVINDLPVFLIILMMGLGMDYEIFLITRVRDLVRDGASDRDAVAGAVLDTGRVITAAGVVMAGTLGTMTLSSTVMLREYGVGLSVAVLLDATLIRLLFVPASLLLLGRYNWWLPRLPWPGHRLASHQLSSHTRRGAR